MTGDDKGMAEAIAIPHIMKFLNNLLGTVRVLGWH